MRLNESQTQEMLKKKKRHNGKSKSSCLKPVMLLKLARATRHTTCRTNRLSRWLTGSCHLQMVPSDPTTCHSLPELDFRTSFLEVE